MSCRNEMCLSAVSFRVSKVSNMKHSANSLLSSLRVILAGAALLLSFTTQAQQPDSQDEESSRQIVLDRFNKARPFAEVKGGIDNASPNPSTKPPVYRRTGSARLPGSRRGAPPATTEEIGITVWRLRPTRSGDEGGSVSVFDGGKQMQYT